jgi:hypothetical protein
MLDLKPPRGKNEANVEREGWRIKVKVGRREPFSKLIFKSFFSNLAASQQQKLL